MPKAVQYEKEHVQAFIDSGGKQTGSRFIKFRGCRVENDGKGNASVYTADSKLVVAKEDTDETLRELYFDPKTGYLGTKRMYDSARQLFSGISRDAVTQFLLANSAHQQHRAKKVARTIRPIVVHRPVSRWQVDLIDFSPLAGSNSGYHFALTCIDLFSKYAWIRPLKKKEARLTALAMADILDEEKRDRHRKPSIVQSDNGGEFKSEFTELLEDRHIKQIFSTSHTPQAQGAVERFNGTIKLMINRWMTANQSKKWSTVADDLVSSYNRTIHKTTRKRPLELHAEHAELKEKQEAGEHIQKQADHSKSNTELRPFKVGDHVRVSLQTFAEIRRQKFRKSYERNWTSEIYTIAKVVHKKGGSPDEITNYYRLLDDNGEKVDGLFHVSRLLYTRPPAEQVKLPEKNKERRRARVPIDVDAEPEQSIAERVKARRNPIVVADD